ncbi:RNA dependent RNA polymerase-domain-containing protein [Rhodocollybia butyracea]|uniref:RNA-dependent RNA polymerase n=1 Tax=Rhodocollybia butyracea TaxID=206335 RepID=A0A9P5PT34_9AGAR|nr:RNA dependent RNA polymerase-domain-containing protein [Rhodocollybia butyracea]
MKRDRSDSNAGELGRPTKITRPDHSVVVVIHNDSLERIMEKKKIPYGIQFQLASIASDSALLKEKEAILERLNGPQTNSRLQSLLFGTSAILSEKEIASDSPWNELDKEDKAFQNSKYACIGNNVDHPGWWGGKVSFQARLGEKGDIPVLEKPILGPSNKIKRRFGSSSVLRVKINKDRFYGKDGGEMLVQLFKRPFVIWHHVFRSFYAKDDTVFLFRTNEIYRDGSLYQSYNETGLSLYQFIQWLNPLQENLHQKLCKWASRTALGLSASIPGPRLMEDEIDYVEDITLDHNDQSTIMTDGCGLSALSLHQQIYEMFKGQHCSELPSALQFRLAGAKGLLLLSEKDSFAKVKLRKTSQIKIKYPIDSEIDPSHLTIDILRFSRTKTPGKLSEETIKNLHHNGVHSSVFEELMKAQFRETFEALTAWEGPDAIPRLWKAVEAAGGVISARKARQSATDSRIRGLRYHNDDDEDDDGLMQESESKAWWRDPTSGCPSSLEETILELLDSGFTPSNSPYLRNKLKNAITTKINSAAKKYNFVLPQSATAFVVPDPYGVLEFDEIHFKNSRRDFLTNDGMQTDIILGEVLITRNPCKLPTDVRKVTAVLHPELKDMVDVIVCSVKGYRRLLDFLAGGDYDGDRALVIWDRRFVTPFNKPEERFSKAPKGLDECFHTDEQTVAQFCARENSATSVESLQDYLLASLLNPNYVAAYSRFHVNAVYEHGYAHWKTVKLAYKFCQVLDSPKTGHHIKRQAYLADRRSYDNTLGPAYCPNKSSKSSNNLPLERGKNLPRFIMDILHQEARTQRGIWMEKLNHHFGDALKAHNRPKDGDVGDPHKVVLRPDEDLTRPWDWFYKEAQSRKDVKILNDLRLISNHVEKMRLKHAEEMRKSYKRNKTSNRSSSDLQPITIRQDTIRSLSREFASSPKKEDFSSLSVQTKVDQLRASYAYKLAVQKDVAAQFPFDCAFHKLCVIKAEASGTWMACIEAMYELRR